MDKIIYKLTSLMTALFACTLTSCDNDPHDPDIELSGNVEKYFPSYCVQFGASYSFSNKSFSLTGEPRFYFEPSEWGIKVDKVEYYLDEEYLQTETVSPYAIEYKSSDWKVGAHTFRADITLSGKNIETFVLQCKKVVDNSTSQEQAADIWFDYNYVGSNDEFYISANINPERSASGTTLTSFSASWDDVSLGTKTTSPFKLTRKVTEESGSKHNIAATLKYKQGKTESTYNFGFSSYEILGPTSARPIFNIKSKYRDYKNGEVLKAVARCYLGSEVDGFYGFRLLLDGEEIAKSTTFPYDVNYTLKELTVGEHTLRVMWDKYDSEGNNKFSYGSDETITIAQ